MQRYDTLVADNIAILKQGIELTSCLGPLYSNAAPRCLQGGIGSHFRHCIDFYNSFLSSAGSGAIRNLPLSNCRPSSMGCEASRLPTVILSYSWSLKARRELTSVPAGAGRRLRVSFSRC